MQVTIEAERLARLEEFERIVLAAAPGKKRVHRCERCGRYGAVASKLTRYCGACADVVYGVSRRRGAARAKWRAAMLSGAVKKAESCEECGASGPLDGHHHDLVGAPLEVEWLCVDCHFRKHPDLPQFFKSRNQQVPRETSTDA